MLSLEKINEEIKKREESDRLTNSVCQELSWLYTVRDHLSGKCAKTHAETYPRTKTQTLDLDMYPSEKKAAPLTRYMAEEWAAGMENKDGTRGAHWTLDQAKQVMAQKGIDGSPLEFWIALNATYSDLCKMFKKYGINTVDAYVDFAKDFWLDDEDAKPDKLSWYYEYVVKH